MIAIGQAAITITFFTQALPAEAVVVGVGTKLAATGRHETSYGSFAPFMLTRRVATIRFRAQDGKMVEAPLSSPVTEGSSISIHYYPDNPKWVDDCTPLQRTGWILLLFGGAALLSSQYLVRRFRSHKRGDAGSHRSPALK